MTDPEPAQPDLAQPEPALPAAQPAPPTRILQQPKTRRKSGFGLLRVLLLLLLAGLALTSIGVLVFMLIGNETGFSGWLPPVTPSEPLPSAAPVELTIIELPATWTPTPSLPPSPTAFRPSATLPPTAPPLPSITPLRAEWRIIIGRSVQGRPIEVYRFGAGLHERMIVAGIHGGEEGNTIALADQLIAHLQKNPDLIPENISLFILRSLNPDGEALGFDERSRFNANGVDLNRNFPPNWQISWRSQGCVSTDPKTAGSAPGSEPETQAFMAFLVKQKIEALVSYHSSDLGIFPAGEPADPESVGLAQAIAAISPYAYPPFDTGCEYTGTLVDFAISQGVQAAVDLELNSDHDPELADNLEVISLLMRLQLEPAERPTQASQSSPTAAPAAGQPVLLTPAIQPTPAQ